MTDRRASRVAEMAREPYLRVFGRFWDGMSFLIASSKAMVDLVGGGTSGQFTPASIGETLDAYARDLEKGDAEWPPQFLLWQSYAYTFVEAHGLLDEYLRASFELLLLADSVSAETDLDWPWDPEAVARLREIEDAVLRESSRYEQLDIWRRVSRMRSRLGLQVRLERPLEAAVKHHRRIRNWVVHGRLTPHAVMPDGTIESLREIAPPPYVPLGPHIVRGTLSTVLAVHERADSAIGAFLDLPTDFRTAGLISLQVAAGRQEWLVDPWSPHPEHLFDADLLRLWRPVE